MTNRIGLALAFLLCAGPALGATYHREDIRLPMRGTGSAGLETMLLRPDAPGRYPLVVISHGSPRKPSDKQTMSPNAYYNNALEFARRGFAVAVVMRRGYGGSGGRDVERSHSCGDPDYVASGRNSAQDIRAAIEDLSQRADVDGSHVIAVGQSAGGFATVALTADPPPGLVAAISFAGGRGSKADFEICNEARLVEAFHRFGATSRVAMLWVYAGNDRFFAPPVADRFYAAFTSAGGRAEYIHAPAFGKDGHGLFSFAGIAHWTAYVDRFLAEQHLTQRATPMALPPLPDLHPPPQLSSRGRDAFGQFLRAGPHKAFAVDPRGYFGWRSGRRNAKDAGDGALQNCRSAGANDCRIVFIDDKAAN